mmetsp:Transcript_47324/g.73965  ORF Transcript_47324/g.73965 Transcript_47324/m.73965 type:complete len:211 (-) Transcript_47324:552-1184(-)
MYTISPAHLSPFRSSRAGNSPRRLVDLILAAGANRLQSTARCLLVSRLLCQSLVSLGCSLNRLDVHAVGHLRSKLCRFFSRNLLAVACRFAFQSVFIVMQELLLGSDDASRPHNTKPPNAFTGGPLMEHHPIDRNQSPSPTQTRFAMNSHCAVNRVHNINESPYDIGVRYSAIIKVEIKMLDPCFLKILCIVRRGLVQTNYSLDSLGFEN